MGEALVAKSYQGLPQISDVYTIGGKAYVKVRMKNGSAKQVRAYSEAEYRKYNPEVKVIQKAKSQRETFGFGEQGFIWLFKGDTYAALDWFREQPTRYARMLGWYLPSDIEMPQPLPAGVTPVKLMWENVCNEEGDHFRPEEEVKTYVESLIFDKGVSKYIGVLGERLTLPLTCFDIKYFLSMYGETTLYVFEDDEGNIFTWNTQTKKDIQQHHRYMVSGTVCKHNIYRNQCQTSINRCRILSELEEFLVN